MEKLHPGARWIFRIKGFIGALIFSWIIFWFAFFLIGDILFGERNFSINSLFRLGIMFIIYYILLVLVIAEIYARMSYNRWFYEFTPTNLKIERGIIWKRYSNVPYERVQNVDITRGIIARIVGFSTINIQTAGYSYTGKGGLGSEGHIPAVSINGAEKLRDFLMKKISKSKGGL